MGLYDFIECEYPLPFPDFSKEESEDLKNIDWSEVDWQTKTFHSALIKYTISEDGQLYENKISRFWEEDKDSPVGAKVKEVEEGIERVDHTGEIVFYGVVLGQKWDHWFEFTALYWKGELKEMELLKHDKEDNSVRLKVQEDFDAALEKFSKNKKRWWFPIYSLYRSVLSGICGSVRWLTGCITKITWKIEKWLP